MKSKDKYVPVFTAKLHILHKAKSILSKFGIICRYTKAKKTEGILRVPENDSKKARRILSEHFKNNGEVISEKDLKQFQCFNCNAYLSLGSKTCHNCSEFVGDPHGY